MKGDEEGEETGGVGGTVIGGEGSRVASGSGNATHLMCLLEMDCVPFHGAHIPRAQWLWDVHECTKVGTL